MIPQYQPISLPAPYWFLEMFLVLGFFLHLIPMNVVLGGTFSSVGFLLISGKNKSYSRRFGMQLAKSLPVFLSFAITQGIVPLLFLQLLYGPLYYTSSIIMALPWLSVIFILLIGYYALYVFKYKSEKLKNNSVWLLLLSGILFLSIGFIFSNNMTLMLHPEKWSSMIDISSTGLHMNHGEAQILPRLLTVFCNSFAVVGMVMGCFGLYHYSKDKAYAQWLIKKGSLIYIIATLIEAIPLYMLSQVLPPDLIAKFAGADLFSNMIFIAILLCSILGILCSTFAMKTANRMIFSIGLTSMLLANGAFAIARHLIRLHFTSAYVQPQNLPVNIQVDLLSVFLILFVGLLVYLAWLVLILLKAYKKGASL